MGRWLLNTFPAWTVIIVAVAALTAASLLGFVLWRKTGLRSPNPDLDTMVSSFASRTYTVFGILLVFVIVALYNAFLDAQNNVQAEATSLAQVVRDTRGFPADVERPLQVLIADYVREVRGPEWDLMRDGASSPQASQKLDSLYATLARYNPQTDAEKAYYTDALSNLDGAVAARRSRLGHADGSIPGILWVMLILGAGISVITMYPFSEAVDRLQFVLIGLSSALLSAGLALALLLDYPFSGSVSVSNAPFMTGILASVGAG